MHKFSYLELSKYWAATAALVITLGTALGTLGQQKLEKSPTMLLMDHETKTRIITKLDQYEVRIDNLDQRVTILEDRVDSTVTRKAQ